jgi:cobalamin 5'-phosphate synthase/cobalamin synthase
LKRLLVAIMFLTRIPVAANTAPGAIEVGRSAAWFPLVGAAVGGVEGLIAWALYHLSSKAGAGSMNPWAAMVIAILAIGVGVALTGALHLDGLADMADGFGGGWTREDVLRIMRDHAIGSYGAVALIMVLVLKIASLSTLITRGAAIKYLIVASALGRGTMVLLGFFLPYARLSEDGLGASFQSLRKIELSSSSALALALSLVGGWRTGVVSLLLAGLVSLGSAWYCTRRIGGITGDTLGATSEICETVILAVGALFSR